GRERGRSAPALPPPPRVPGPESAARRQARADRLAAGAVEWKTRRAAARSPVAAAGARRRGRAPGRRGDRLRGARPPARRLARRGDRRAHRFLVPPDLRWAPRCRPPPPGGSLETQPLRSRVA